MSAATLHYIYDPFCGWCYGAAPLLKAAETMEGITVQLHAGGMMTGSRKQRITPEWRSMVMQYDQRIAAMSGQKFGDAYRNVLLQDPTAVFDSEPPTTAILAATQFARGLQMLHRVQDAHFIEGQKIADPGVLVELATEIGMDRQAFAKAYAAQVGERTSDHINESRQALAQAGGMGFPTFVLEAKDSHVRLDHGPYLGKAEAWATDLARLLTQMTSA
jgi:putative protein-disulfide isomerase